jgi:hypothetical protein
VPGLPLSGVEGFGCSHRLHTGSDAPRGFLPAAPSSVLQAFLWKMTLCFSLVLQLCKCSSPFGCETPGLAQWPLVCGGCPHLRGRSAVAERTALSAEGQHGRCASAPWEDGAIRGKRHSSAVDRRRVSAISRRTRAHGTQREGGVVARALRMADAHSVPCRSNGSWWLVISGRRRNGQ